MKSETRISPITSFRMVSNSREIKGTALVFNQKAFNGMYYESIHPDAVQDILTHDIRCLYNGDKNKIIGRTKSGTLAFKKTSDALEYYCSLPNTTSGNDLIENIKLGNITNSIALYCVSGEKWSKEKDGFELRTVTKISQILSVGPATFAMVDDLIVSLRNKQLRQNNLVTRLRRLKLLALKMRMNS